MATRAHEPGAGLAPPVPVGVDASAGLSPLEDQLVLGPMRAVRARMDARKNYPAVRALDECIPLVAQGLIALLRIKQDGLVDIDVDGPSHGEVTR